MYIKFDYFSKISLKKWILLAYVRKKLYLCTIFYFTLKVSMQYIVVYETKNAGNRQLLLQCFQAWNISYNQVLSNTYFCVGNIQRNELYDRIRSTINTDADLFLIADFDGSSISGWLPNSSVTWYKENIR